MAVMNGDDVAHVLRFLYGDENGLGLAAAAQDMRTKPERLREIVAGKRPIPPPWQGYLLVRVTARRWLDGWRDSLADRLLMQSISEDTLSRLRRIDGELSGHGPA